MKPFTPISWIFFIWENLIYSRENSEKKFFVCRKSMISTPENFLKILNLKRKLFFELTFYVEKHSSHIRLIVMYISSTGCHNQTANNSKSEHNFDLLQNEYSSTKLFKLCRKPLKIVKIIFAMQQTTIVFL